MSIVIPIQEPVFAFTSGETFDEFCAAQPLELAGLLRRIFAGVRLDPDTQLYLTNFPTWLTAIVIVEDMASDTAMIVPILVRMAEACPRLELRIVSTDMDLTALNELVEEDLDLEDDLDDLDLPLVLFFDEEWNQQARWGPRPAAAEKRLADWLAANPDYEALLDSDEEEDSSELTRLWEQLIHQMRFWYNDDLTAACMDEIRGILETLEPNE